MAARLLAVLNSFISARIALATNLHPGFLQRGRHQFPLALAAEDDPEKDFVNEICNLDMEIQCSIGAEFFKTYKIYAYWIENSDDSTDDVTIGHFPGKERGDDCEGGVKFMVKRWRLAWLNALKIELDDLALPTLAIFLNRAIPELALRTREIPEEIGAKLQHFLAVVDNNREIEEVAAAVCDLDKEEREQIQAKIVSKIKVNQHFCVTRIIEDRKDRHRNPVGYKLRFEKQNKGCETDILMLNEVDGVWKVYTEWGKNKCEDEVECGIITMLDISRTVDEEVDAACAVAYELIGNEANRFFNSTRIARIALQRSLE